MDTVIKVSYLHGCTRVGFLKELYWHLILTK